ncbi:MAG: HAD-IA family hydrolase [Candidatus Nanoarchaeia archaeon]|nr:HAD-IA family hydrolase [Candidatus Nanoarchaeia archaeon]
MIEAVLFDLDNTLTDTYSIKIQCIKKALKKMIKAGLNMPFECAFNLIMKIYKKSDYESSNIFQDFLTQALGKIDYKILSAGIVEYRKIRFKHVKPYPEIKDVLKKLKKDNGLILGILSDSPRIKAWIRIMSLGLSEYFDLVLTYEDVKSKKPSRRGFIKAAKMLGIAPGKILFVGDIPHKDIIGAKNAGMRTALAKYGQFLPDSVKPDYVLNSPGDLLKIIKAQKR